jgi:hypothetical protein
MSTGRLPRARNLRAGLIAFATILAFNGVSPLLSVAGAAAVQDKPPAVAPPGQSKAPPPVLKNGTCQGTPPRMAGGRCGVRSHCDAGFRPRLGPPPTCICQCSH